MYKIIFPLVFLFASCANENGTTGPDKTEQGTHHKGNDVSRQVQPNNGAKWKADETTRKNADAIKRTVSDSSLAGADKAPQLARELRTHTDMLIKECSMSGAAHEALHTWLEQLLHDIKELDEKEPDEYAALRQELQQDAEMFYEMFE